MTLRNNDQTLLATLYGEILSDVFNFNRLKPCFIRHSKKNITSIQKLTDAVKQSDSNNVNMFSQESQGVEFHDEHCNVLPEVTRETVLCLSYTDPLCIQPYLEACEHNKGLAFPYPLKHDEYLKQFNLLSKTPKGDLEILRARYKLGQLQVLLSLDPEKKSTFWWNVGQYSDTHNIMNYLMENNIRMTGSPEKLHLALFG